MKRLPFSLCLLAAATCLSLIAGPAAADVVSTLTGAGTWVVGVVRVAAILIVVAMAFQVGTGRGNVGTILVGLICLAVALYPQEIVNFIT